MQTEGRFLRNGSLICVAMCVYLLQAHDVRAQDAAEQSIQGLSGVGSVAPGGEVQVYAVELLDTNIGNPSSQLGTNAGGTGIRVIISDLSVPTGLVSGDFTELRVYRSTDNSFDGGDVLLGSETTVNIGAATLIDVTIIFPNGDPNRAIPETPAASIFFIVTAVISGSATGGHAFRLGTGTIPPGHIDLRETGGGPATNYTFALTTAIGSQIIASDANRIVISGSSGSSSGPTSIPFQSKWTLALLLVGYGVWTLIRHQ